MSVQSQIKHDIHTRLEQMSAARVVWEEGTMRAATTELYAILEQIYALYSELKAEVGKRRAFASLLTDLDLKTQANTSLALKVIRSLVRPIIHQYQAAKNGHPDHPSTHSAFLAGAAGAARHHYPLCKSGSECQGGARRTQRAGLGAVSNDRGSPN